MGETTVNQTYVRQRSWSSLSRQSLIQIGLPLFMGVIGRVGAGMANALTDCYSHLCCRSPYHPNLCSKHFKIPLALLFRWCRLRRKAEERPPNLSRSRQRPSSHNWWHEGGRSLFQICRRICEQPLYHLGPGQVEGDEAWQGGGGGGDVHAHWQGLCLPTYSCRSHPHLIFVVNITTHQPTCPLTRFLPGTLLMSQSPKNLPRLQLFSIYCCLRHLTISVIITSLCCFHVPQ